MTVANLINNAVAQMGGDLADVADYSAHAYVSINTMLADLFEINNALLVYSDEDPLTEIPSVDATDDTLTYDNRLLLNVMVYGLARDLSRKDNNSFVGYFTRMYDEKKESYNIGVGESITDYYTDTDEE